MHGPGVRSQLAVVRRLQLGRLAIEVVVAEHRSSNPDARSDNAPACSYLLVVPLSGALHFVQNGRGGAVAAEDYVLLREDSFHELSAEPGRQLLVLRLPASDLRGRLVCVEDHVGGRFEAHEHLSRLLVSLIRSVSDVFSDSAPPNPEALATEIVSFVALTLGAENRGAAIDVRNARYYLRRRIFDFIERHLSDQDLSPRKIAASSRISLSYLYSLFSDDDTTVVQFVRAKRLQRAYEILVADARGHRTVSEIAYEVGFKNVSHFSRSFSRHFRVAPRDVREAETLFSTADAAAESSQAVKRAQRHPSRRGAAMPHWPAPGGSVEHAPPHAAASVSHA